MTDTKKPGRPRNFDPKEALQTAINVFWEKGYEGASVKDLTTAMGINSPSLYAAFGDKHELFLKAIELYSSGDGCAPLVAFETEPDIRLAVRAFLETAIDYATQHESGARGCFLSSCLTNAGTVEGVEALLSRAIQETDAHLAARFDAEKTAGNLPGDFPSMERARLMFDLRQGFVFRARAGLDRQTMLDELDHRVQMVVS
ncbi:MAG: TetR/AcrR family transcriptional regulator [Acidobacteriota bacterium]